MFVFTVNENVIWLNRRQNKFRIGRFKHNILVDVKPFQFSIVAKYKCIYFVHLANVLQWNQQYSLPNLRLPFEVVVIPTENRIRIQLGKILYFNR